MRSVIVVSHLEEDEFKEVMTIRLDSQNIGSYVALMQLYSEPCLAPSEEYEGMVIDYYIFDNSGVCISNFRLKAEIQSEKYEWFLKRLEKEFKYRVNRALTDELKVF